MRKKKHTTNIRKRKMRKHKRTVMLLCLFFMCFLLLYGVVYFTLYLNVRKLPENKVCEGIWIGKTDVSGCTQKEALALLEEKEVQYGEQVFQLKVEGKKAEVKLQELGFEIQNEEKLVDRAMEYGKTGSVFQRYFQVKKLKKEKKILNPHYTLREEESEKRLKERVAVLFTGASNATIKRMNGKFVVTEEKSGVELDEKATVAKISDFLNQKWNGKSANIQAVEKVQKPTIVKKQLEEIQDLMGRFSTYCGSGQNRVTNIEVGTKKLNGIVLMPGQELSAGNTMRPFTEEEGYVEAGAYENGEVVKDIAGGICQVSSTLYNAVINAELEVTSRQPHSMIVNYVKPSKDAAIAGDYKDLKFKNNTKYPIYIEGYVAGEEVHFNIYGKDTRAEGRKVEYISETLSTEEIQKKYVADPELELGKVIKTSGGHKGVKAQLWKVVYENGKEVSREVYNKSTYKPSTNKIRVGIKSEDLTAVQKIKEAVNTQDEAKINAAINEVKGQQ